MSAHVVLLYCSSREKEKQAFHESGTTDEHGRMLLAGGGPPLALTQAGLLHFFSLGLLVVAAETLYCGAVTGPRL